MVSLLKNRFVQSIIIFTLGVGGGYYFAPDSVKTEKTTTQVGKKVEEKTTTVVEKFEPKSGRLIERIKQTGTKDSSTSISQNSKKTETNKKTKHYALKLGTSDVLSIRQSPKPRIGAEVRLPFFSSWVGTEIDIKQSPTIGAYIRLEF